MCFYVQLEQRRLQSLPNVAHRTILNLSALVAVYRTLTRRLTQTDRLIDQIVYRLYNLTEEEIAIIESQ